MPICNKCKTNKAEDEFYYRNDKGRLDYHCKLCQNEYSKGHYEKNKTYYVNKAARRTKEIRDWVLEFKTTHSCALCKENHPACLEFHHLDPRKKDIEVSRIAARGWSMARLQKEVRKCSVLCSNCHKKLHWKHKLGM